MMGNSRASESGTGKCTALTLFLFNTDRGSVSGNILFYEIIFIVYYFCIYSLQYEWTEL